MRLNDDLKNESNQSVPSDNPNIVLLTQELIHKNGKGASFAGDDVEDETNPQDGGDY